MSRTKLSILYEDNHLLVLDKPAGIATMGTSASEESLLDLAKQDVKDRYDKPGNVYLGVVSRLDKPVSGVVLFARTSKAAARLSEQFREQQVSKVYWALVSGKVRPAEGTLVDWLAPDEPKARMQVVSPHSAEGKEARLAYRTLLDTQEGTLLEVRPETGRKHQIRLQLAHLGHPIFGDRKYGSRVNFAPGIALHARSLEVTHPTQKNRLTFTADLPGYWKNWGVNASRLQE